jgi:hypothetical protein
VVGRLPAPCSGCAGGCIQQTFVLVGKLGREEWPDTLLGPETTGPLISCFHRWVGVWAVILAGVVGVVVASPVLVVGCGL